jgi:Rrf2 family nitric oxide-sensitive transcriptional repressor
MFSQTVEYALRAMVFLTANTSTPTSAQVIAAHAHVPERYMSKVMRSLVVAGLAKSRRGPTGGFMLSRPSSEISMLSVVEAVEALPRIEKCPLDNPKHVGLCPMHRRLDASYALIRRVLGQSTLQEVAAEASPDDGCGLLTANVALAAAVGKCGGTCAGGCKNLNNEVSHAHDDDFDSSRAKALAPIASSSLKHTGAA